MTSSQQNSEGELFYCTQCGFLFNDFIEGVCSFCHYENQKELDLWNARYERWEKFSDVQREAEIRFHAR